jgi:hypothetical protein
MLAFYFFEKMNKYKNVLQKIGFNLLDLKKFKEEKPDFYNKSNR